MQRHHVPGWRRFAQHGRTHAGLHAQVMGPWQVWGRSALAVERHKQTHLRTRRRGCLNVTMTLSVVHTKIGTVQLALAHCPTPSFKNSFKCSRGFLVAYRTRCASAVPLACKPANPVCCMCMRARAVQLPLTHQQAYMTFDRTQPPKRCCTAVMGTAMPISWAQGKAEDRDMRGDMKEAGSSLT